MALLTKPRTAQAVGRLEDINPLACQSVVRRNPTVIKRPTWFWITFKEARGKAESNVLGFGVVPQRTESITVGKSALDELRFVSNRHSIEPQALGFRFPAVLPSV